jgi:hypothetical protein
MDGDWDVGYDFERIPRNNYSSLVWNKLADWFHGSKCSNSFLKTSLKVHCIFWEKMGKNTVSPKPISHVSPLIKMEQLFKFQLIW